MSGNDIISSHMRSTRSLRDKKMARECQLGIGRMTKAILWDYIEVVKEEGRKC